MRTRLLAALFLSALPLLPQPGPTAIPLPQVLKRLGEQADAFRRLAPSFLAEETLEQRTRPPEAGAEFPVREVVSEYGYAALSSAPNAIHEIRKVISVDGKQAVTLEKARQALTLGLKAPDDKLKKRLLEDFEKHGLRGAATDFGQILLLFSARHQNDYEFQIRGERQIGAERLIVLTYTQKTGESGVTFFVGNAAERQPLHGEISVRRKDLVPLRITMIATQKIKELPIREESTVDYKYDPAGLVLPVSVVVREYIKDELHSENTFSYTPFRRLAPGAGVKLPGL